MRNPTAAIARCTAMRRDGQFCDRPSAPDMPFPICLGHAVRVAKAVTETWAIEARTRAEMFREEWHRLQQPDDETAERVKRRTDAYAEQSQVYYVRIGDHVKIGVTTNLRSRLRTLRVDRDAVLATEPGAYDLERQRHLEFADERVGRREDFNPSRRLLAHIADVRATHGEPNITGYLHVA